MVYPADFEAKIGFDILRSMLEDRCLSEMGREHCRRMSMMTDRVRLKSVLSRVDEMVRILTSGQLPLDAVASPSESIALLKAEGSHISAEKFAELGALLTTEESLRRFFDETSEAAASRPELTRRFRRLPDLVEARKAIERVVNRYGQVRDNASPQLAEIRRNLGAASAAINGLLRRVMDKAVRAGALAADAAPSVRDGHLVIPVAAANRRQIPGIVFDQSATGKTYFIEPAEVVEANNRLKELRMAEAKEIIEILTSLSAEVRPWLADIAEAASQVGLVDFIRAKALLACELDGQLPTLSKEPELDWYHAVHPVLLLSLRRQGREVVPLQLRLDGKTRIVVISGPNAGGKSVCLKTVAIVQYMMQCGLLPTLHSNSHMGVFAKLLIDIGDDQSIADDLSTYSSHLRNMRAFLSKSGPDTLFLADEMGSGTEPVIGGAIAQAILAKLNADGAFGVVTTHYQNLKTFANETEGFVNAAMLYDRQHLQPLFKLAVGTPGSSFALDIARKSGIPADVISSAKEIAGSDYVSIDKYLLDLARDRKYWADKRLNIKEKERKLDQMTEQLQSRADQIKERRAEILHQARQEARTILDGANARIENAIRDIRAAEAEKEQTRRIRRELDEYRAQVSAQTEEETSKTDGLLKVPHRRGAKTKKALSAEQKPKATPAVAEWKVGDYVTTPTSSIPGRILSISGTKAEIALGALRTFQSLDSLKPAKPPRQTSSKPAISSQTYEASRRRQLDFHNQIDVRGMRADEALQAVTYLLDDAIQFQASRLRILHGTGTGALRQAIRQMLQAHPDVKRFHDEDVRLGGAGITVVEMDD